MLELRLPFPAKELSPNARLHWAKVAKVKKAHRADAYYTALPFRGIYTGDEKLRLELKFYKPSRRAMDRDNLLSRMKASLDGIADGLGINDRNFDPVVVSVADQIGGYVEIKIMRIEE